MGKNVNIFVGNIVNHYIVVDSHSRLSYSTYYFVNLLGLGYEESQGKT